MDQTSLQELLATEQLTEWFQQMRIHHESELIALQLHTSIEKELHDWCVRVEPIQTEIRHRLQVSLNRMDVQPLSARDLIADPEKLEVALTETMQKCPQPSDDANAPAAFHLLSRNFTFRDFKRGNGRLLPLDDRFAATIVRRAREGPAPGGSLGRILSDFIWANDLLCGCFSRLTRNAMHSQSSSALSPSLMISLSNVLIFSTIRLKIRTTN
jgi:hypothetical protein